MALWDLFYCIHSLSYTGHSSFWEMWSKMAKSRFPWLLTGNAKHRDEPHPRKHNIVARKILSSTSSSWMLHHLSKMRHTHDAFGCRMHRQHHNLQCDMTKFKNLNSTLIDSLLALCLGQSWYFPQFLSLKYEALKKNWFQYAIPIQVN